MSQGWAARGRVRRIRTHLALIAAASRAINVISLVCSLQPSVGFIFGSLHGSQKADGVLDCPYVGVPARIKVKCGVSGLSGSYHLPHMSDAHMRTWVFA